MEQERYDRQQRIPGWDQQRLRQARVLVAGAGTLGNEVIKNLVLLGVGHLMVLDGDSIERSNLSRTVLFREHDIGRPKAVVAAEAAKYLAKSNPNEIFGPVDIKAFQQGSGHQRRTEGTLPRFRPALLLRPRPRSSWLVCRRKHGRPCSQRLQIILAQAEERVYYLMNRAVGEAYRQTLLQLVRENGGRVLMNEQTGSVINLELELY